MWWVKDTLLLYVIILSYFSLCCFVVQKEGRQQSFLLKRMGISNNGGMPTSPPWLPVIQVWYNVCVKYMNCMLSVSFLLMIYLYSSPLNNLSDPLPTDAAIRVYIGWVREGTYGPSRHVWSGPNSRTKLLCCRTRHTQFATKLNWKTGNRKCPNDYFILLYDVLLMI